MRIIRRTFANLSKSVLQIGREGENHTTRLEIDVTKEQKEFVDPSFELVLNVPAASDPYPVLVDIVNDKMVYYFSGSDLSKSGDGQLEALVIGQNGELLKSTTARVKIETSIIPNSYPGPLQKVIDDLREAIGEIGGVDVVDALPSNPERDALAYVKNTGLYWYNGTEWVQLTDDFALESEIAERIAAVEEDMPSAGDKLRWDDAADKKHTHNDLAALNRIVGTESALRYGEKIVKLEDEDNYTPLELNKTYSRLVFREHIEDVSVCISSNTLVSVDGEVPDSTCIMHVALLDSQGRGVHIYDMIDTLIASDLKNIEWIVVDRDLAADHPYKWQYNDSQDNGSRWIGYSGETPVITNFTPTQIVVENGTGGEVEVALKLFSQILNVSESAMGIAKNDSPRRYFNDITSGNTYYKKIDEYTEQVETGCEIIFSFDPDTEFPDEAEEFSVIVDAEETTDISYSIDPDMIVFLNGSIESVQGIQELSFRWIPSIGKWLAWQGEDYKALEVVSALPAEIEDGKLLYLVNSGIYFGNTPNWVQITSDTFPTSQEINKWNAAAEIVSPTDDVTLLSFKSYPSLSLRQNINDVPVYIFGAVGDVIGLSEDKDDSDADSIIIGDVLDDSGLPVRIIKIKQNTTDYIYYSRNCTINTTSITAGWYQNGSAASVSITNFNPSALLVGSTWYTSLVNLPDDAKSALRSLSQMVNETTAKMGTVRVSEEDVVRFAGFIEPNRRYSFSTSEDCAFDLPSVSFDEKDAQFVLYLSCTSDVDLTFPQGTLFVGGAPNSDRGNHKLIGSYIRDAQVWAIGGVDYEEAT